VKLHSPVHSKFRRCLQCLAYIRQSVPNSYGLFAHVDTRNCFNFLIKVVASAYDYQITLRNDDSQLRGHYMFNVLKLTQCNKTLLERILES
jgi:hypothetical protein